LLEASIADGRHRPVIEAMLRWTGEALEANEELLRQMIHDRAHALVRWTGLDETLANTILDGLYRLLAECVVDPNHPLRAKLEEMLAGLAQDLRHDEAMQARGPHEGRSAGQPAMGAWIDALWDRARAALLRSAGDPRALLDGRLGTTLAGLAGPCKPTAPAPPDQPLCAPFAGRAGGAAWRWHRHAGVGYGEALGCAHRFSPHRGRRGARPSIYPHQRHAGGRAGGAGAACGGRALL
jgi:hypothetical protein